MSLAIDDARDAEIARLTAEVARLRQLIDRDRTGLADALGKCLAIAHSHGWLASDGEWGCYEWDERTEAAFRREVREAFDRLTDTACAALAESGRRAFLAFHPDLAKKETQ